MPETRAELETKATHLTAFLKTWPKTMEALPLRREVLHALADIEVDLSVLPLDIQNQSRINAEVEVCHVLGDCMYYSLINYPKPLATYGNIIQGGRLSNEIYGFDGPVLIVTLNDDEHETANAYVNHKNIIGNISFGIKDTAESVYSDDTLLSIVRQCDLEISRGTNLYIHCYAGFSRSTYVNAALLMYLLNISSEDAIEMIAKDRPGVNPNGGFRSHLKSMESRLRSLGGGPDNCTVTISPSIRPGEPDWPTANAWGPGEGPIAWPSADAIKPQIVEAVGDAVDRGLLPEMQRQAVTPGGPKAFIPPYSQYVPRGFTPHAADSTPSSELDKQIAAIKAQADAQIEAVRAQFAPNIPAPSKRTKIPAYPKIGIAICTHAYPSYVTLHLECLRRHEPNLPVLVHDDCSYAMAQLRTVAQEYGATFRSTSSRRVPTVGDLSGFVEALRWGDATGLDIVVKCSRRFIIDKPWAIGLGELMHNTQYATASAPCSFWQWGYRSELVAMHVPSWIDSGALAMMEEAVRANLPYHGLPEAYTHDRAKEVHRWLHPIDPIISHWQERDNLDCDFTVRYEQTFPHNDNHEGYAQWLAVMGLHRNQIIPDVYWHDSHSNRDYGTLARSMGLNYSDNDFFIPAGD